MSVAHSITIIGLALLIEQFPVLKKHDDSPWVEDCMNNFWQKGDDKL